MGGVDIDHRDRDAATIRGKVVTSGAFETMLPAPHAKEGFRRELTSSSVPRGIGNPGCGPM